MDVFENIIEILDDRNPSTIEDYKIVPMPSFRGATRVWMMSKGDEAPEFYIKRLDDVSTYRRYLTSIDLFQDVAEFSQSIKPLRLVYADEAAGLVVTGAVRGVLAVSRLQSGARLDKILSWRNAALDELSTVIAQALDAVWSYRPVDNAFLEANTPADTAARMRQKASRLKAVSSHLRDEILERIDEVAASIERHQAEKRLLIGDVDLANMLLTGDAICFFDLDDIGVGDKTRDLACLLHRLELVRRNRVYAGFRVASFSERLLKSLRGSIDPRLISAYQTELVLDALWSAFRRTDDASLPVHGISAESLVTDLRLLAEQALR